MALETASYISQLVATNPPSSDPKSQGDNHLRLIKNVLQTQFPSLGTVPVTATAAQINALVATAGQAAVGTSSTPLTVGAGSKTFATQTGRGFAVGQAVKITDQGNILNQMIGTVSAYDTNTGDMAVIVASSAGSGTASDWAISVFVNSFGVQGADIPSAATVDLDAATGDFVHVTGSTGITAITLSPGSERTVVFDGVLTITHHATTLNLPGGLSITTAAGDRATFRGDGSGNTRCIHYTKASGQPVIAPAVGLALLSTVTASNSATVDVENTFDGTYDAYMIVATGVTLQNQTALNALMKIGGSYVVSGYSRHLAYADWSGGAYLVRRSASAGNIEIFEALGNASTAHAAFTLWLDSPMSTAFHKTCRWEGVGISNVPELQQVRGVASNSGTAALTGMRFQASGGNIVAGSFRLYGIRRV